MARHLISPRTRDAFRDAAVTLSRTYGETCFERLDASGIRPKEIKGERSTNPGDIVEAYYAAINWSDPREISPFIDVFEEIYNRVPDSIWGHRQELSERLSSDGLEVKAGKLVRMAL